MVSQFECPELTMVSHTTILSPQVSGLKPQASVAPRPGTPYGVSLPARREGRIAADKALAATDAFRYEHARGRFAAHPSQLAGANPRRFQPRRLAGVRQSLWPRRVRLCSAARLG